MLCVALDQGLDQSCLAYLRNVLVTFQSSNEGDVLREVPQQQQLWGAPLRADGPPEVRVIAFP